MEERERGPPWMFFAAFPKGQTSHKQVFRSTWSGDLKDTPSAVRRAACSGQPGARRPVAGVFAVILGHTQHLAHQPGVFLPADEPGHLPVGGYLSHGDLLHHG